MNAETRQLIKQKISDIDEDIRMARDAMDKAKAEKEKAVAIFNTCQAKLFELNTAKNKYQEDLPING